MTEQDKNQPEKRDASPFSPEEQVKAKEALHEFAKGNDEMLDDFLLGKFDAKVEEKGFKGQRKERQNTETAKPNASATPVSPTPSVRTENASKPEVEPSKAPKTPESKAEEKKAGARTRTQEEIDRLFGRTHTSLFQKLCEGFGYIRLRFSSDTEKIAEKVKQIEKEVLLLTERKDALKVMLEALQDLKIEGFLNGMIHKVRLHNAKIQLKDTERTLDSLKTKITQLNSRIEEIRLLPKAEESVAESGKTVRQQIDVLQDVASILGKGSNLPHEKAGEAIRLYNKKLKEFTEALKTGKEKLTVLKKEVKVNKEIMAKLVDLEGILKNIESNNKQIRKSLQALRKMFETSEELPHAA
jgi:hypothetical protein